MKVEFFLFVGSNRQFPPSVASDHSSVGLSFQSWPVNVEPTKGRFLPPVDLQLSRLEVVLHRHCEVTGATPVEAMNFAGFSTQLLTP